MDSMQGWYGRNGNPITIEKCLRCLPDANKAKAGFNQPDGYTSWWWGNPKPDSAMSDYIEAYPNGGHPPEWGPHLKSAFIIQDFIPVLENSIGNYSRFLVMTWEQNIACGRLPGPVTCMGFRK